MAGRKRLGQEHTCRCSSTYNTWIREGGKWNCKAGAEGSSGSQKLLLPLESVAELLRALVEAEFSQRRPCRLLPVYVWNKQQSQSSHGMSTRAGVSEQGPAGIPG